MKIDILSIFPEMFEGPFTESMIKRAQEAGVLDILLHNIRDYSLDKHKNVDDTPYGGGPGMVMRVDVLHNALKSVLESRTPKKRGVRTIYMSPQGKRLDSQMAQRLSSYKRLVVVCGRYEGVDERFLDYIDEEVSIGDYVLTGGELPAMVMVDAISRYVPGVVGDFESVTNDSFHENIFDCPHYTRPREYDSKKVPDVLVSGHAANISKWRNEKAIEKTKQQRPDLLV